MTGSTNRAWQWTIAVFAVALLTRLLWISVPINTDEVDWLRWGSAFMAALLEGRPANTYQFHHPGVTNMWINGGAIAARYFLHGVMPSNDLTRHSAPELQQHLANLPDYLTAVSRLPIVPLELYVYARMLAALVTAACMAGFYALSRRLFSATVAAIATVILLLEPFFLAYQRFLTTDANQANFTWLALLAFLLYLRAACRCSPGVASDGQSEAHRDVAPPWWAWSLLSGAFLGLALLSKVSAALSLPAFALALVWWIWKSQESSTRLRLLWGAILCGIAAVAVAFLLWPALSANLPGTLAREFEGLGQEVGGHRQFFLGQAVMNPGPAFYPLVLVFRLSPLLLLGSILGLISLLNPALRRHLRHATSLAVIVLDLVVVLLGVTSQDSKLDRYIIPLMPGLALLAASGISAAVSRIDELRAKSGSGAGAGFIARLWASRRRPVLLLCSVIALQLAVLLPHVPYYVTYFNPLAGGPAIAQKLLMVGNGELLDQVAAWLRQQSPKGNAIVASWHASGLGPYYGGLTLPLSLGSIGAPETWRRSNFVVLYVNNVQRNLPPQIAEYFAAQRPVFEVQAHGVDYARVYPGPSVDDAGLAKVAKRVDLDFEGYARLVGYDLETPEVAAAQTGVLALYWQAVQSFPERDFTVHIGIRDADGNVWSGIDGVPVDSLLPVDQWQPGQLLRDVQRVTVPPGTPPGEYTLEVSFWSPTLQRGLEIRDGDASLGRRATLTRFRVIKPSGPPDLASDLGIAHRVKNEVEIAAQAARLVGYEGSPPASARAGDAVPLVMLWQAGTHERTDVQLHLRLSQGERYWLRAVGHPLGGSYAPANWTAGQLVRDTWNALLPADAPGGRYSLELVSRTMEGDKVLLVLGTIELLTRPHSFEKPNPQFTQEADLSSPASAAGGAVARLLGYDLPAVVQPGRELPLTLYWKALGETDRNYVRFVHVLDTDNRIVAQQDDVPGAGEKPLTSWLAGETLQDDLAIAVPAGLPAGRYRLVVGMYDPATGQRLKTHDDQEQILLSQKLEVG